MYIRMVMDTLLPKNKFVLTGVCVDTMCMYICVCLLVNGVPLGVSN